MARALRVADQKYMKNGEQCVNTKTLVYQKGVDAVRKRINSKIDKDSEIKEQ